MLRHMVNQHEKEEGEISSDEENEGERIINTHIHHYDGDYTNDENYVQYKGYDYDGYNTFTEPTRLQVRIFKIVFRVYFYLFSNSETQITMAIPNLAKLPLTGVKTIIFELTNPLDKYIILFKNIDSRNGCQPRLDQTIPKWVPQIGSPNKFSNGFPQWVPQISSQMGSPNGFPKWVPQISSQMGSPNGFLNALRAGVVS